MTKRLLCLLLVVVCTALSHDGEVLANQDNSGIFSLEDLSPDRIDAIIDEDTKAVKTCRLGLERIIQYARSQPALFLQEKLAKTRMLTKDERRGLCTTWQTFLDCCLSLDALQQTHASFHKIQSEEQKQESFSILYGSFLAQYRYALEWLEILEKDPALDIILNEPNPVLGLPEGAYAAFKFRFLNVMAASEFVALNTINAHYGRMPRSDIGAKLMEDKAVIWNMGKGKGVTLTLGNAMSMVKKAGFSAWIPIQKGISQWMGDTKVWRIDQSLISMRQIRAMSPQLEPGDIMLERREWYMSNLGLPGFWTHAALYVGTREERSAIFKGDPEVCRWLKASGIETCDIDILLESLYPDACSDSLTVRQDGYLPRVIEAVGEGVVFTTLEHSAHCDSLAVLRPKLSKKERAIAIKRAFSFHGRPYDFNFDFLTDESLVCSELVYKSYEPSAGYSGVEFPIVDIMGRKLTPPNEIVHRFDQNFGTPDQQVDLVFFYDGDESTQTAACSTLDVFRNSWKRPKWHILLPAER